MSRISSFPQRERSERVGLSTCVKHGHVVQSAQPQLVSFLKSPAVNMKMKMRNAPKLAKYASDHFGPENRPHLNFNFKGGLFSATNGSKAYLARYDAFGRFSKVNQLIVQSLRDPHFRWQAGSSLPYHTECGEYHQHPES